MDKKEIAAVWQAFLEVQEGKKRKNEKLDPVGQEDGDIDNDGDKDSSDEYLAKRRKAIGKAMGKDDKEKEQKEGKIPPQFLKGKDKKDDDKEDDSDEKSDDKEEKGKKPEKGVNPFAKKKDDDKKKEVEESSCKTRKEEDEEECPECKGKGCDHCDGKGYHKMKKENPAIVALSQKRMKKESLFSEEELARLEERAETAGAAKSEPFMSTNSAGEKKFYADHKKSDKKFEDMEDQSEMDGSNAGKAVKSQSPARRGDNRKGDTAMKTVSKTQGQ